MVPRDNDPGSTHERLARLEERFHGFEERFKQWVYSVERRFDESRVFRTWVLGIISSVLVAIVGGLLFKAAGGG